MLEGGDQVAVTVYLEARLKRNGQILRDHEIHLWTFDGEGRAIGLRHYLDTKAHYDALHAPAAAKR